MLTRYTCSLSTLPQILSMNLYKIKRTLLAPYIRVMRYKERHLTGFIKAALELHYYRPEFYRFIRANVKHPDILHDAPIKEGAVVVDVGAYVGEWAERMLARYQANIYAFELDPRTFPKLARRFEGVSQVHCFDYGLGGRDSTLTLNQKEMGSTLYDKDGQRGAKGCVDVKVRDIVGVFDELGLQNVDLLKINIEGGEYEVLDRLLDTGRIKDVDCLMVQFHEWLDNANWHRIKIRHKLRKTHRQVWNYTFVWEQWVRR